MALDLPNAKMLGFCIVMHLFLKIVPQIQQISSVRIRRLPSWASFNSLKLKI